MSNARSGPQNGGTQTGDNDSTRAPFSTYVAEPSTRPRKQKRSNPRTAKPEDLIDVAREQTKQWALETFVAQAGCSITFDSLYSAFCEHLAEDDIPFFKELVVSWVKEAFPETYLVMPQDAPQQEALAGIDWAHVTDRFAGRWVLGKIATTHREAGRKLMHLPEPARTRMWLRMFLQSSHDDISSVEMSGLWQGYEDTFKGVFSSREGSVMLEEKGLSYWVSVSGS